MTAIVACLVVTAPIDDGALLAWAALGVIGVTGIGLVLRARFARVSAGLMFAAGAVLVVRSLVQTLTGIVFLDGVDAQSILSIANAVGTTLLLVWLCIRAIQVMVGTTSLTVLTVRLAGCVLAVVAANHLWLALQVGDELQGSWSVSISPQGTQLFGFPGWALWHVTLLVTALGMLALPRRLLRHAATALLGLVVSLVPLIVVGMVRTDFFDLQFGLVAVAMALLPVYLAWWLRDELQRLAMGADPASLR